MNQTRPIARQARDIAHTLGLGRSATLLLTTELSRRHTAGRREGHRQATREWAIRLWEARFGELNAGCLRQLMLGPSEHAGAVLDAVLQARTSDDLRRVAGLMLPPSSRAQSASEPAPRGCGPAVQPKALQLAGEGCAAPACGQRSAGGPTPAPLHRVGPRS